MGGRDAVMSAWDTLNDLDAYGTTEIPRRQAAEAAGQARPAEAEPGDTGRTQRLAAPIAAYHARPDTKGNGAGALAVGWIRHGEAGPVPRPTPTPRPTPRPARPHALPPPPPPP